MKLALRILTSYVLFFTTISTFFIVYNLRNIPNSNGGKNGNIILQNIICNDEHGRRFSNNKIQKLHSSHRKKAPTAKLPSLKETTKVEDLNTIIKSIKKDIYSPMYQDQGLRYDKDLRPDLSNYKESLSLYNGVHSHLIGAVFPDLKRLNTQQIDFDIDRIQKQIALKIKQSESSKKIFLMFKSHDLNEHGLMTNQCYHRNCIFTNDISEAESADVILFNGPPKRMIDAESKNRRNQIWVYQSIESPVHNQDFDMSVQMNWTATYRSDSVIPTPYAKFVPFENVKHLPYKPDRNYALERTKLAAIVISNCDAENGRLDYIWELKKFASVDIFGSCGDKKCVGNECFEQIKRDYKFYMAFENSNCRQYITEKFFKNALQHDVIPIVMGAHPEDYKQVAPPNSYIHVDEFNSPRQLAEYMHILDNNDDLYNEYFRWKGTGEFINTKFVCRLCAMVHAAPVLPLSRDINKMLTTAKKQCIFKDRDRRWISWKSRFN